MNAPHPRPLSPHLQVYRLPLTAVLSITHRITGVLLSAGLLSVVCLLSALAAGPEAYASAQAIAGSGGMRFLSWAFIYALFFHLCHGIRHLIWDAGQGFEAGTLNRYAWIELTASVLLTLAVFVLSSRDSL
ncbi:succinate dehydrogenase, cytochrome b556 subunit [Candidatus Methylomicrobium oryzae]|uniref:succinate dehydrogenase, cytochrome b556 subunit n=1 Tax=Candidatus Methylomicrobium oryzae TaxID=2802053 RepID=UPI0019205E44|nr:succinate dehydrogenase, cytochrome b556 subunit [Methylomicrobium sp. RS1]MBL1264202.1 succinate dehydrogenase, cytochrome b556 subunit [Methylomicrobium sp. RS1]